MQKVIIIASLLLVSTLALSIDNQELSSLWSAWRIIHSKYYEPGESEARFAIFRENYKKIIKFNANSDSAKLGLNKFSDLTAEEFKIKNSRCAFVEEDREFVEANTEDVLEIEDLPDSIDWRKKDAVTPVKDQGQCGSCWSFSSTGVLEGFYAIKNKKLLSFSEQQIVDCDATDYGCMGGWPYQALVYAGKNGLESEDTYPYTAQDGKCKYKKGDATKTNTGYTFVKAKSVNALKTALVKGPVSVAIEADEDVFQQYSSGVIKADCGASLDHAVLVVGYKTISGVEAWIVKNSWGTSWGNAGYVYIATDPKPNDGTGVCGILSQPVVPK